MPPREGLIDGPATNEPFDRPRLRRIGGTRTTGRMIQEIWDANSPAWEANYWRRVDDSLLHLMGGSQFILPENFLPSLEEDARRSMIVILPQKMTVPLKVINLLGDRVPKAMRYAVGLSTAAESVSTNVETWLNAVMVHDTDGHPLVNYREASGRLLLEGAVVVKALSSDAHWRRCPSWLDLVDKEEYADLSARRQKRYAPEDDVLLADEEADQVDIGWTRDSRRQRRESQRFLRVDKEGQPVPRARFWRDARDRKRDDPYYSKKNADGSERKFAEDRGASRRAYQAEQKDWLARRLPFEIEIISARHCVPLFDDNEKLEAIVVMREYDAQDLIARDFIWGDDLSLLTPSQDDGPIVVWELWHVDERDRPYVSYFVDGAEETRIRRRTDRGEELVDAVIDLQREFGCTRLPIRWFWGLNFPVDDVTQKAVPFLWPVLPAINAAEGLATATAIYAWRNAFSGKLIEINPAMLERYGDILFKNSSFFNFDSEPMTNTVVPGRPIPDVTPAPGAGVQQLLQMLLQSSSTMFPSEAAFGQGHAVSGHDRALSKEYLEVSISQVLDSSRMLVKFVAECILEYAVWIAEKTGKNVPVYANVPVSQASVEPGKPAERQRQVVELKPSWLGLNTEVHTYFEGDDISDLERQQLAQQHMQGLVPWDEYRTRAWQDPYPEITLAKIFGDQAVRTPEGRQEIMAFAREIWGDEQEQEKQRLIDEGLLSPDGVPMPARVPYAPAKLQQAAEAQAAGHGPLLTPGANGAASNGAAPGAGGLASILGGATPPPGVPPELAARHLQLDQSHAFARGLTAPSGPLGPIGGPASGLGLAGPPIGAPAGPPPMPGAPPAGPLPGGAPVPAGVPLAASHIVGRPGAGPGGPVGGPLTGQVNPILQALLGQAPPQVAPPRTSLPPGVHGAADHDPYPGQHAAAPTLPGMSVGALGPNESASALGGVLAAQLRKAAELYHDKRSARPKRRMS